MIKTSAFPCSLPQMFSWICVHCQPQPESPPVKPKEELVVEPEIGCEWMETVVKKENFFDYLRIQRKTRKGAKGELSRFFACADNQCTSEEKFQTHEKGLLKSMLPTRFSLPQLVGAGGQGVVLTVLDSYTNSRSALKLVFFGNRKFVSYIRICREIQIGKICSHPNICELLEVFSPENEKNISYVIMLFETVDTTLSELLRACYLNPSTRPNHRTISGWVYQLLSAVCSLHDRNIIHRDLKPSNIGMTTSPTCSSSATHYGYCDQVKLLDMGMARVMEGERPLTPELGTYSYMAPELLMDNHVDFNGVKFDKMNKVSARPAGVYEKTHGFNGYDKSVDVWAVAVMFAEMLLADGTKFFQSSGVVNRCDMVKVLLETVPLSSADSYRKYIGKDNMMLLEEIRENMKTTLTIDERMRENLLPHDDDDLTHLNGDNARELLNSMLQWNPTDRINAHDAMKHPYFTHLQEPETKVIPKHRLRDNVCSCSFYDERLTPMVPETVLADMTNRIRNSVPWSRLQPNS